jgi:hypothetical protein
LIVAKKAMGVVSQLHPHPFDSLIQDVHIDLDAFPSFLLRSEAFVIEHFEDLRARGGGWISFGYFHRLLATRAHKHRPTIVLHSLAFVPVLLILFENAHETSSLFVWRGNDIIKVLIEPVVDPLGARRSISDGVGVDHPHAPVTRTPSSQSSGFGHQVSIVRIADKALFE